MKKAVLLTMALVALGCQVKPKPIAYGTETCAFCRMTIVDRQHAAQLVTAKGRSSSFDAIECLVHQLGEMEQTEMAYLLVSDYTAPGKLIDASEAVFLVSPGIPSPMGANLSAFSTHTDASETLEAKGGSLYDWEGIQVHLKSKP